VIDAHVHLWTLGAHGCAWPGPDLPAIHRDFALHDLCATLDGSGVDGVVLVQSQEDPRDTEWLLGLAADPLVRGVVGWCDLKDADAVRAFAVRDKLVGLRPMVQDRDADWYDLPAIQPGLAAMAEQGLVLDALIRPAHLPALTRLAERLPSLAIVIDHAAKPHPAALPAWHQAIAEAARLPNIHCKLSGLWTELPPERVEPLVDTLLSLFGPDRLLWGSDWPVLTLAGTHRDWLAQARRLIPLPHHAAVFESNARTLYRLETV
jgi:L-fuconolactonase